MHGKNFSDSGVNKTKRATSSKTFEQTLDDDAKSSLRRTKTQLKDDLKKLGTARAKCFKVIFKHMASMMCLTCDANYASKNIKINATSRKPNITLATSVCTKIKAECYEFIN